MAIYLLKINVSLMLLYGFYRLLFSRDTFFSLRRVMLICAYAIAALVPAANIEWWIQSQPAMSGLANDYAATVLPTLYVYPNGVATADISTILVYVYVAGVLLLTLRMAWQLASIALMVRRTKTEIVDGISVHVMQGGGSPFSFFKWIFVNPSAQSGGQLREILVHERAHAAQYHSADVLLTEFFTILCWPNPFSWLMKREVRINLEYLADSSVIESGSDQKQYQYHLLGLLYHKNVATISNNFNVLPLKKRIKMMNKRRTCKMSKAKYLLFAPLAASLLVVSNVESVARTLGDSSPVLSEIVSAVSGKTAVAPATPAAIATDNAADVMTEKAAPADSAKQDNACDVAEEMPIFPGGPSAMMQYLNANVRYPQVALKNKIEGRVVVSFIIERDGSVTNAKVIRSVDPALDAEAARVVKSMPNWIPGKNKGEAVRVKYNVPVSFKTLPVKGGNDNSASVDLPAGKYYINDKEATTEEVNELDKETIKSISVKRKDGATSLFIDVENK